MDGDVLLDTNIVLAMFADDQTVLERARIANNVFVSSIVIGELFFGAYKSARVDENVARVAGFVSANAVLSCNADTAQLYGQLKTSLRSKGRPIPENDIWIAAIAGSSMSATRTLTSTWVEDRAGRRAMAAGHKRPRSATPKDWR